MTFVTDSYNSPREYLEKFKAAYDTQFKYRILGKVDSVFENLARAVNKDSFDALRRQRVAMTINVNKKLALGDNNSLKHASNYQVMFTRTAVFELNAAKEDLKPSKLAFATYGVTSEFKEAVERYVAQAGENPELARDKSFKASAQLMYDKLKSLVLYAKVRLRSEMQYYNTSVVNAEKELAQVKALLDSFTPGVAAASSETTVPAEEPSQVDVEV